MNNIKTTKMKTYITLFTCFFIGFSVAQNLVYKPKNPAFGGDTFNYQWMLSSANAQNQFDDGDNNYNDLLKDFDSMDSFTQSLNRQLLSQLSGKLIDDKFGTSGGMTPGKYMFGSLFLDVSEASQGLVINILDTQTGEQSQIIIPR